MGYNHRETSHHQPPPDPIISSHNAEMPRIAEFGPGLGRAVTEGAEDIDSYEAPLQATFEVEVLCKNLHMKLEDIPLRNDVLAKRIAPAKERNPDFNVKASATTKAYPAASTQPLSTIALPQGAETGREPAKLFATSSDEQSTV